MVAHPLLRRLLSPAGLVLVALCFALPFAAISCESREVSVTAEYTGTDLLTGGTPTVSVFGEGVTQEDAEEVSDEPIDVQPAAVAAMAAVLAGILVAFLPARRIRLIAGAVTSVAALLLLVVNQILVHGYLGRHLERELGPELRDGNSGGDFVEVRYGFWLALASATLVATYQLFELYRDARGELRNTSAVEPPPASASPDTA